MTLEVDPAVLRAAATTFGQAADALANVQADRPLTDAAAAASGLQTAIACRAAAEDVAAELAAVSDDARQFSDHLLAAAGWYEKRDAAADAIYASASGGSGELRMASLPR